MCLPFTHFWILVECIGNVYTYRCTKCPKTMTRVRG
ncbi:hypothetical protein BJ981_002337 [Sphaerisporangium krabiense]|uniref:Uncharacterized protein n=1 Tax=Sphaerisporangium krabiense TaxID=763782 RepID=A0A7W8Z412_9ACTN|nr:hypothetical protein [Sphaerisporangium krabiense]